MIWYFLQEPPLCAGAFCFFKATKAQTQKTRCTFSNGLFKFSSPYQSRYSELAFFAP